MSRAIQRIMLACLLLALGSRSLADSRPIQGADCTQIDNDIARLECYDEVFADYRQSAQAEGIWTIETTRDPIDDKITTFLITKSQPDPRSFTGLGSSQLVIRCAGNKLDLYVKWGQAMEDVSLRVTHRVGDLPAQTEQWLPSTSRRATFYPGDASSLVLLMQSADRFVTQIPNQTFQGRKMTAVFSIIGLQDALTPIKDRCIPESSGRPDSADERAIQSLMRKIKEDQNRSW